MQINFRNAKLRIILLKKILAEKNMVFWHSYLFQDCKRIEYGYKRRRGEQPGTTRIKKAGNSSFKKTDQNRLHRNSSGFCNRFDLCTYFLVS